MKLYEMVVSRLIVAAKNYTLLVLPLLLALSLSYVSCDAVSRSKQNRPNVLLILADDLGYGDIGAYNPSSLIPTPNLNRLAEEGVMLTNAYCPVSVCSPSRFALMTGIYPWRSWNKSGVMRNYEPSMIGPNILTLPGMLRDYGYFTAGFGKWHLGASFPTLDGEKPVGYGMFHSEDNGSNLDFSKPVSDGPTAHGFEKWYGFSCASECWIFEDTMVRAYLDHDYYTVDRAPGVEKLARMPMNNYLGTITDRALDFIVDHRKTGKPFFLFYAPYVPHVPLAASESFVGSTNAGAYGDYVHELDYNIGRLLEGLDAVGLRDDTIVLFASDNGSAFKSVYSEMTASDADNRLGGHFIDSLGRSEPSFELNKGKHHPNGILRGWKGTAWEGGVRTPFLARWPNYFHKGAKSTAIFSLNDVLPSIGSILGFKFTDDMKIDGYDQMSVFRGAGQGIRNSVVVQSGNNIYGYRKGDWKLIAIPTREKGNNKEHFFELYNLDNDPSEKFNLTKKYPEKVKEMYMELQKCL